MVNQREWHRASIPEWKRIRLEAIQANDRNRREYAEWMLDEILDVDEAEWDISTSVTSGVPGSVRIPQGVPNDPD
jgi:hypothetical protein